MLLVRDSIRVGPAAIERHRRTHAQSAHGLNPKEWDAALKANRTGASRRAKAASMGRWHEGKKISEAMRVSKHKLTPILVPDAGVRSVKRCWWCTRCTRMSYQPMHVANRPCDRGWLKQHSGARQRLILRLRANTWENMDGRAGMTAKEWKARAEYAAQLLERSLTIRPDEDRNTTTGAPPDGAGAGPEREVTTPRKATGRGMDILPHETTPGNDDRDRGPGRAKGSQCDRAGWERTNVSIRQGGCPPGTAQRPGRRS